MEEEPVIGIDLGTTYSCVGVVRGDEVEIIPNENNSHVTASCVFFKDGERLIGDDAKDKSYKNPSNAIYGVKRIIGRTFREYKKQENKTFFSYLVTEKDQRPQISVNVHGKEQTYAPEEISAMVLKRLKDLAEKHLKTTVSKAVIAVPAHFNDAQRQATKTAGRIACLEVMRIINEPTAAALAYELNNKYENTSCNVLIYDFGGGTFDVSIVVIENGIIEVKATNGDPYLGGDDIDKKLTEHFIKEFREKNGLDMSSDKKAVRRLQQQCEKAKRNLSIQSNVTIELELLYEQKDLITTIDVKQLEEMNKKLFQRTLDCVRKTLEDARLTKEEIQEIVLVGGSSRIPYVRKMVKEFFGNKELNAALNPDEAIATGAARQGAIMGGNCSGKIGSILLYDVCSLSLGVEVKGGLMNVLIPRNSKIPAKKTKTYRTTKDNQVFIDIPVYEGERVLVKDNRKLGKFKLEGLAPLPKGHCTLEVTFEVDSSGILNVMAEDCQTKTKSYYTTQSAKGNLSEEQILKMIEEAATYKEEDELHRRCIEAKNDLENYCNHVLEFMKYIEIDEVDRHVIKTNCEDVENWLKEYTDLRPQDYHKKRDELYKICSALINSHV